MNSEDYLANFYRIIRENFRPNDPSGSMTVASAAYLFKHALGFDQTSHGFAKFKDVLKELEKRGILKTGVNSKNAAVDRTSTKDEDAQREGLVSRDDQPCL